MSRADVVLVVDDSPETVRLLTDVLDGAGMTVMVALDGMAALKIAAQLKPDIVLMDALMPGMDGFETCRRLKTLSGFADVPILFMTGLSEPEDSIRGFKAGGADYVTKPIVIDAMLARIQVHLANGRKIQSARMALDAADQFLVATDRDGEIRWFTPRAYRLLEERFRKPGAGDLRLPDEILDWLRSCLVNPQAAGARAAAGEPVGNEHIFDDHGLRSRITFMGEGRDGEILFRIADAAPQDRLAEIRRRFPLTAREAEVLSWLSLGKSNRDIAAILKLSPRTIDKHLEVIFAKLGVENRTAATALVLNPARS
jgi:DNA-binding NarL/FixJ family response regulator